MSSWGSFKDACGCPIDEYLAPADIEAGGDAALASGNEVAMAVVRRWEAAES